MATENVAHQYKVEIFRLCPSKKNKDPIIKKIIIAINHEVVNSTGVLSGRLRLASFFSSKYFHNEYSRAARRERQRQNIILPQTTVLQAPKKPPIPITIIRHNAIDPKMRKRKNMGIVCIQVGVSNPEERFSSGNFLYIFHRKTALIITIGIVLPRSPMPPLGIIKYHMPQKIRDTINKRIIFFITFVF